MKRSRLVVLISGHGRNLKALLDASRDGRIEADPVAVICNRADAPGLEHARSAGIETIVIPHADYPTRAAFDIALGAELRAQVPDIVALAGFMRILGDDFVREFEGRMLNVHPSLLPKHHGLHTHARALEACDTEHGATIHFVTPELDGGPRVIQGRFIVGEHDDAQMLAARTMEEIELKIYPQAVAWMARGELRCEQGNAMFRGRPLIEPMTMQDLEPAFR